ncbi:hypothetical protein PG996_014394 [Apiospora saccharicola]|uniref:Uncharacterized protein n=1 Tax=Apiospora saccharicola TaxID=335842 RepID=A0ABR1TI66_9PEZI
MSSTSGATTTNTNAAASSPATCSPVNLAALAPSDANYAYIESNGDPVRAAAMTACCGPEPAHVDGCYAWCRLPEDADIDAPESQVSWERDFQYCLKYQGRLASDGGVRFVAPWVRTVQNKRKGGMSTSAATSSSRHGEVGGVKWAVVVSLGVLSWALA